MKINSQPSNPISQGASKVQNRPASSSAPSAASSAQITLGAPSSSVTLQGVTASQAPFDAKKVASIKQAIANGQFTVRPEAVADKLIASVSELLKH